MAGIDDNLCGYQFSAILRLDYEVFDDEDFIIAGNLTLQAREVAQSIAL